MTATIRDVARRAGVARGTVSRVLNDSPNVHPATRDLVLRAIADLEYVPSRTARSLSLGTTQAIGVVVPFITRPSVVERLRGIELTLADAGYDMTVLNVETVARRDAIFANPPGRDSVDGLIVVSLSPHRAEIRRLTAAGTPVVLVDAHHPGVPRVVVDDVVGGQLATDHLLELGHRDIGFIGDQPRSPFRFTSSRHRHLGYRRALLARGIVPRPEWERLGDHSRAQARSDALGILTSDRPPTALVCASDTQALGVLEAARDLRLQVPADLSVIGYDDIEIAEYVRLTTVHQPLLESGIRASRLLLDLIARKPLRAARERQAVELVVRHTTGPAPARRPTKSPRRHPASS